MNAHVAQKQGLPTCGAAAYASIMGLTELQAIRECKTKMSGRGSGTKSEDVMAALEKRGIASHDTFVTGKLKKLFWLAPLSSHFPLYVVIKLGKDHHAIAIIDGYVYDGHNTDAIPIDSYKNATMVYMIVVDKELDSYGRPC